MNTAPGDRELHLWWAAVPADETSLAPMLPLLSAAERRRADRFKVEHPRRCLVAAHFLLRTVLGGYAGLPPTEIEFVHGEHGKPYLASEDHGLQFNLSHSGDHIALAVSTGHELGVDVEVLRAMPRAERLARRFFSTTEAARLAALSADERLHGFFHLWTAKEAFLKATGTGLSVPLRSVEISPHTADPIRIESIGGDTQAAATWTLLRPASPSVTICTIAIQGSGWVVRQM